MPKIKDYYELLDFVSEYHGIHFVRCKVCGDIIFNRYRVKNWDLLNKVEQKGRMNNSIRYHINNYHSEKKKKFSSRSYIGEKVNILVGNTTLIGGQCKTADEYNWYFCLLCGLPHYKKDSLRHIESCHIDWINAVWIEEKIIPIKKQRHRYPLKPWKDPQSLFCSPNLKDIINKEPLHGDECKDIKQDILSKNGGKEI